MQVENEAEAEVAQEEGQTTESVGAPEEKAEESQEEERRVPYERFEEVVRQNQGLRAEIGEVRHMIDARLPRPEPEPEAWVDPDERAGRLEQEIKQLRSEMKSAFDTQSARGGIEKAVTSRQWEDPDDVRERLSERYYLAQSYGNAFDADAEAKALHEKEQARANKRKQTWANEKKQVAQATTTVSSRHSPPTGEAIPERPPIKDRAARDAWEKEQSMAILSQFIAE
jgi:hypothetical protein